VDDYELRDEVDGCPLSPAEEGRAVVFVQLQDMAAMRDKLRGSGVQLEVRLAAVPLDGFVSVADEDLEANLAAIDAFEALDDVDSVEHNIDMTGGDD
jgi:transcriptional/translational regulatory protein YebC/TACO1